MLDKDIQERILAEFDTHAHTYEILAPKLEQLLSDILKAQGIEVHIISSRAKKRKSLIGKLAKENVSYEQLTDVTDLVGLRITTYFAEDVDRVAAVIAEEFDIDFKNSVDKRQSLAADRFGYLSRHQVMSLKDSRCELTEYRAFKGLKVELQTRSILQHAWAEIEHDLGYKSEIEVPQSIRRRFALVAGLLELADREFDGIKKELEVYREVVAIDIKESPSGIMLNLDSLKALIEENASIKYIDREIIIAVGASHINSDTWHSSHLENLQAVGLETIGEVIDNLQTNQALVVAFAKEWLGYGNHESLGAGICLFYLWYVLISNKEPAEILQLITDGHYNDPYGTTSALIEKMAIVKSRGSDL